MKNYQQADETEFRNFAYAKMEYQKWAPIFIRLGLKPRRYFRDAEAVYMDTTEGRFRLSLVKYEKQDLRWLRSVLEYLDERAFKNWAVPWQKSIIWEESNFCYLIQPWITTGEGFQIADPASITRVAEVLADFHHCGKDYCEMKGLAILRDEWSKIETKWEESVRKLDQLKEDMFHEKIRPEINELKKAAATILSEIISNWRNSGINTLMEHHRQTGVLGHGNLLAGYITWRGHDFYLLNWEHLAFQPRVKDLASLINDMDIWEPEWILYFIHEYSKLQPFWPEEYPALWGLLRYPKKVLESIEKAQTEEPGRKNLKEGMKALMRKERCLAKVWRELGTEKRWNWNQPTSDEALSGKVSMVLSPVEVWGNYTTPLDSLIQISNEHKLPPDIMERLTHANAREESNRVVCGRDGSVLDGSAGMASGKALNFNDVPEYATQLQPDDSIEPSDMDQFLNNRIQPELVNERSQNISNEPAPFIPEYPACPHTSMAEETSPLVDRTLEIKKETPQKDTTVIVKENTTPQSSHEVIRWSGFPKKNGVRQA